MERVAFLLEETRERFVCLLNPGSLVLRRTAGVRARTAGGHLTGAGLADDPLLYTGGGRTEMELDLLFDVELAGSTITTEDVRTLTAPFWNLSENRPVSGRYGQPPIVRFIWGKHWNIPGVVVSVAERMEHFTAEGAPRRSWLKMKLLRVQEPDVHEPTPPPALPAEVPDLQAAEAEISEEQVRFHEISAGDRLDDIATQYYGEPSYWRLLANFNGIEDPFDLAPGMLLMIPPAPDVVWWALQNYEDITESLSESFSSLLRLRPSSPLRIPL